MALVTTTLSSAVLITDKQIAVTSATNFLPNQWVRIDDEWMQISKNYVSGTTIPVQRGQIGSVTEAHPKTANVITDAVPGSDWSSAGFGTDVTSRIWGVYSPIQSISATATLVLPTAGTINRIILNGTSGITLTIPLPTTDMDGTILDIASNGAAAHVITFTSTLNNAGSGYTSFTNNASGTMRINVMAVNGFWTIASAPAWTGTVTKVTGGIA
jgi:hypothetical protein